MILTAWDEGMRGLAGGRWSAADSVIAALRRIRALSPKGGAQQAREGAPRSGAAPAPPVAQASTGEAPSHRDPSDTPGASADPPCASCGQPEPYHLRTCSQWVGPGGFTETPGASAQGTGEGPVNQCDGCRRGLPKVNGIHRAPESWDGMVCTAGRYVCSRTGLSKIKCNCADCTLPAPPTPATEVTCGTCFGGGGPAQRSAEHPHGKPCQECGTLPCDCPEGAAGLHEADCNRGRAG